MINTKLCCFLLLTLLLAQLSFAQKTKLREGDLLFQNLDCGEMCEAIEAVTQGYKGMSFSHVGLVTIRHDSVYVIESMGDGVRKVPLNSFRERSPHPLMIGRLKKKYRHLIPAAVAYCNAQMGKPYDEAFIYGNDSYYCSELLYDAFKNANENRPFFRLYPMTFKQPHSQQFFPVWEQYYAALRMDIPEGKPGCNPGGMSRSGKIKIIGDL